MVFQGDGAWRCSLPTRAGLWAGCVETVCEAVVLRIHLWGASWWPQLLPSPTGCSRAMPLVVLVEEARQMARRVCRASCLSVRVARVTLGPARVWWIFRDRLSRFSRQEGTHTLCHRHLGPEVNTEYKGYQKYIYISEVMPEILTSLAAEVQQERRETFLGILSCTSDTKS